MPRNDAWLEVRLPSPVPLEGRGRMVPLALRPGADGAAEQELEPPATHKDLVPNVAGQPRPDHRLYMCRAGQSITVAAPGLLVRAARLTAAATAVVMTDPFNGSVSVAADGRFTYTPTPAAGGDPAYTGWYSFRFKVLTGTGSSAEAIAAIFVTPTLKVRAIDRYRHADWSEIAHIRGGW